MADSRIVIPNWDKFQHYKDRDVPWIKDYKSQLDNEQYLDLTFALRGLLHDLRLLYLGTHKNVTPNAQKLSRRLNMRVTSAQLETLNQAGLIAFQSRHCLAQRRKEEREEEIDRQSLETNGPDPDRDPDAVRRIREAAAQIWKPL